VSNRQTHIWGSVVLLGLTTIGAYGVAYYAIGVLIPAIADDTGWRAGSLATAFSLGLLLQGGVALCLGRLFDRWGSVLAFGASLGIGAPLLFVASFAAEPWQFILAWTLGAASIGGGLYYNVTMPALGRLFPERRATALSGLTLLGAFASPIFYPLAAALIELMGWRSTLRVLVALLVAIVLPAVLLVRAPGGRSVRVSQPSGSLATALSAPAVYRALVVVALAAFANSAVMLHQLDHGGDGPFAGGRIELRRPERLLPTSGARYPLAPPSPHEPASLDGDLLSSRRHFCARTAARPRCGEHDRDDHLLHSR